MDFHISTFIVNIIVFVAFVVVKFLNILFCFLLVILMLLSGDIEVNPGPQN